MSEKAKAGQADLAAKRAQWGNLVAQWKRSGQSQKAFCIERGLVLSTFQWWCARAKRRDGTKAVEAILADRAACAKRGGSRAAFAHAHPL